MTIPTERTRAVLQMGKAVGALAPYLRGNSETVRIPRTTIRELFRWLRHYPTEFEMECAARNDPTLWRME